MMKHSSAIVLCIFSYSNASEKKDIPDHAPTKKYSLVRSPKVYVGLALCMQEGQSSVSPRRQEGTPPMIFSFDEDLTNEAPSENTAPQMLHNYIEPDAEQDCHSTEACDDDFYAEFYKDAILLDGKDDKEE